MQPTEKEAGERTYTCLRCGEQRTEVIPERSHVHSYTALTTHPTCTAHGYTAYICSCGDQYQDSVVPALGHDYRAEVIPPTCTEAGYSVYTCTRCGDSYAGDEQEALGHDWDEGTVSSAPTQTEPVTRIRTCLRCGEQRTEVIPELDHVHSYIAVETAPTCTENGYTTYTCICGVSYTDGEVPALGHEYEDGLCIRCGKEDPDRKPPESGIFRFDDVTDDRQFFYHPVYWAVDREITNGASPTTFNPGAGCTRAQVVTFLWRAAGKPEPNRTTNPFQDIPDDQYYTKAVLWAVEKEITNGTGVGLFSPDATCTRGQIVTFLWRYFEKPEIKGECIPFADVMEGQYYTEAILWAVKNEITNGSSADRFSPNSTCTRSQIVTFLYRAMPEAGTK